MLEDYYTTLSRRVVTKTADGAGGETESIVDTDFEGYIALMSNFEIVTSAQLGTNAVAKVFTKTVLSITDRVVDGSVIYEVVGVRDKFHLFYELKTLAND